MESPQTGSSSQGAPGVTFQTFTTTPSNAASYARAAPDRDGNDLQESTSASASAAWLFREDKTHFHRTRSGAAHRPTTPTTATPVTDDLSVTAAVRFFERCTRPWCQTSRRRRREHRSRCLLATLRRPQRARARVRALRRERRPRRSLPHSRAPTRSVRAPTGSALFATWRQSRRSRSSCVGPGPAGVASTPTDRPALDDVTGGRSTVRAADAHGMRVWPSCVGAHACPGGPASDPTVRRPRCRSCSSRRRG